MAGTDTPFVHMLQHYMWRVRTPPINPNKLANELGVSRTTVANWLNGTKPAPEIVPELAQKMGLPVEDIMNALGYPVVMRSEVLESALADLARWVAANSSMNAEQRKELQTRLDELKRRFQLPDLTLSRDGSESENSDPKAPKAAMAR